MCVSVCSWERKRMNVFMSRMAYRELSMCTQALALLYTSCLPVKSMHITVSNLSLPCLKTVDHARQVAIRSDESVFQ